MRFLIYIVSKEVFLSNKLQILVISNGGLPILCYPRYLDLGNNIFLAKPAQRKPTSSAALSSPNHRGPTLRSIRLDRKSFWVTRVSKCYPTYFSHLPLRIVKFTFDTACILPYNLPSPCITIGYWSIDCD